MGGADEVEKAWNFDRGTESKVEVVASAATVLVNNVKEVFGAQGLLTKWFKEHALSIRGPVDFPRRRRRSIELRNGDQNRDSPWLPVIVVLLLVAIVGGVVVLFQLHAIQEGQSDHERRIYQLERNRSAGHAPS